MTPVHLAFFWHQHQPYYPDDVSGEVLMPWVRLHATNDYYGMAMHIKEVPEFRCTINLVPSLLVQLEAYVEGRTDRHLDISRLPADGMAEEEVIYLVDNFFMANVDSMVRPYPRFWDLYLKRGFGVDTGENAARRFNERDIRDLQIWSNLTWMHELAFEYDPELKEFRDKGKHWTEEEKHWLLDKQRELVGKVIPLHRELAESGQVELTTTPFYHPILPLLWNKASAHQAMPGCALPQNLESYREDAVLHIKRGIEYHEKLFGEKPRGMWPSEGSVSQEIIAAIAKEGIKWIATDEEILAASTDGWISRDGQGHMRHPEMLFRPWLLEQDDKQLGIIFRDHAMSDLIGFHYQRDDPEHAAHDLISRVEGIGRAVEGPNNGRPAIVPIILDGENCWEYYPDGGVKFLRTLYQKCTQLKTVKPVRVGDHIEEHPPTDRIKHLFAGSWISHNFAIWIGHHEDNTAWDRLHEAREFLKEKALTNNVSQEQLDKAWEELYIAEGSDWYWWFGDDHSSAQDGLFDQLFRKHLQNIYMILDEAPPGLLNQPITRAEKKQIHSHPTGFLPVKVTGNYSYFEWVNAGHYVSGNERGTMTIVTEGLIREVLFGFDQERILLRLDTLREAADDLQEVDSVRVRFYEPSDYELRITGFEKNDLKAKVYHKGKATTRTKAEAAIGRVLEIAIPRDELKLESGQPVHLYVEALKKRQSLDRAPREGVIELQCPSPDFELEMWQA
ncbi:glycoside hydrolase family 57 protein [Calycomorphotria hydatis]|uniref:Glycosyl hydrolase family 57 n=1 Tax=Calycomorphotria hydatis TaxID=2528027 RepID=A0A517T4C6_9PLAN|nr:glycoside hydrolase family 57 protein [Calycomorphotria hydatis]QDT63223.1 Glycosyl hydrolase family 57 [Calycomorphotria hydatis]